VLLCSGVNFGIDQDVLGAFQAQRRWNQDGFAPLFSAEYYPGWLTHWGEKMANRPSRQVAERVDEILRWNASVRYVLFVNFNPFFLEVIFHFKAGLCAVFCGVLLVANECSLCYRFEHYRYW
jgi:hypothetical protein